MKIESFLLTSHISVNVAAFTDIFVFKQAGALVLMFFILEFILINQ